MEYLIIFIAAIFVVLWGISIYLIKTGKLSAHDWSLKSLGLPRGSVRAIFGLIILFLIIFSVTTKTELPDLPPWAVGILGTIIGFYFGAAMAPKAKEDTASKPQ